MIHKKRQNLPYLEKIEQEHVLHDFTAMKDYTVHFMTKGSGVFIEDVNGKRYLDFKSCAFNVNLGYQHPRLISALIRQANELCYTDSSNLPEAKLTDIVLGILESKNYRLFYSTGGALSVETALKIARDVTKRPKIISFLKNYHGVTYGAMSIAGWGDIYNPFGPMLSHNIKVPPAYCYRCYFGKKYPRCHLQCVEYIENLIKEEDPNTIAAIIAEPIPWGEMIVPPREYWKKIEEICDKYDILLMFDEIVTGFGRTGEWFAKDLFEVNPDIIISGKGLTAGTLPLYVAIVKKEIADYYIEHRFTHGYTFQGYPIACAVAIETINTIREQNILKNVKERGEYLYNSLRKLSEDYEFIGDVRGVGLMYGVELIHDRDKREPINRQFTQDVIKNCHRNGLIIGSSIHNFITVMPPFIVSNQQIDDAMEILNGALKNAAKKWGYIP